MNPPVLTCSGILPQRRLASVAEMKRAFEQEAQWHLFPTPRYRCRYYSWGQGPPLVFIHGLADDALSFVPTIYYLREHFRCIAYDLPKGRGDGANMRRYRHEQLCEDLLALLDHLALSRTYVYGSSFGSTIAIRAMATAPDRFARGVYQGGFAHRNLSPGERFLTSIGRLLPGTMRYFPFKKAILIHQYSASFRHTDPELWDYFVERYCEQPMAALAYRGHMLVGLDLRPLLPRIRQPVLLVCGEHDPLVDRNCEEELERGLPNPTRVTIRGCGHHPYFSHPDVLAELVYRFLTPLPCELGVECH